MDNASSACFSARFERKVEVARRGGIAQTNVVPHRNDRLLRAVTKDGAFRVIAIRTTETVRGAIAAQLAKGDVARSFGELLTASVLVRELMAPGLRLQAMLSAVGTRSRLVADAHPEGLTRGLVQIPKDVTAFPFGPGAQLTVMRSLRNGALHQGTVEVPDGPEGPGHGGVAHALMQYLHQSEQVLCALALGVVMKGDEVRAAGGYVVQLLPETSHEALALMTTRLSGFVSIDHLLETGDLDPASLLDDILRDMPFSRVAEGKLEFGCLCNEERVLTTLSTLGAADVEEILAAGEVLEIGCDYCGKEYRVAPEKLRALQLSN